MTFRALRALWMFILSALFHATSNWILTRRFHAVQESRFFLSNYFVCLAETILESKLKMAGRAMARQGPCARFGVRMVGYVWVLSVLCCLTPAWQYPRVYAALGS
jgi:hypothetical protein